MLRGIANARSGARKGVRTASANYDSYHDEYDGPLEWYEGLALVISGPTTISSVSGEGLKVEVRVRVGRLERPGLLARPKPVVPSKMHHHALERCAHFYCLALHCQSLQETGWLEYT